MDMHELVMEYCVQGVDWVTETDQSQNKLSWHSLQGLAIQSFTWCSHWKIQKDKSLNSLFVGNIASNAYIDLCR